MASKLRACKFNFTRRLAIWKLIFQLHLTLWRWSSRPARWPSTQPAYVVGRSGRMYVYSPGGILQRSFTLPNLSASAGAISIDATPDGCTLVYVGDGASANRFNTCAHLALARLAPGKRFEAVHALSDGGFAGPPPATSSSTTRLDAPCTTSSRPRRPDRRSLLQHRPQVDVDRQRRVPGQVRPRP